MSAQSGPTPEGSTPQAENVFRRMLQQPMRDLRGYRLDTLRRDGVAGLTVAVVAVPQSLAYAVIAGVPPQVGIHTLIVQGVIGALVGSQPFLSSGPINTQSLLVAAIVTRILGSTPDTGIDPTALYLQLVVGLTLIKGVLQVGLAAGGFANLVRYVSASVILGFTAGAGILIAAGQLGAFLGLDASPQAATWPALAGTLQSLLPMLDSFRAPSIWIGLLSLATVIALRRLSLLAPGSLVAVVLGAATVAAAGLSENDLPLVAALPAGLPRFSVPSISAGALEPLVSGAFALAVLGMMEAWSIAKTIAAQKTQRISATQELLGQGLSNMGSAFFGCMPGSGSFSRSALNVQAGAATRYASLFNALFAAVMLLAFAPFAAWIPQASLSAVLFVIAYDLIDWRTIQRLLRTSRTDASVCLTTLVATLTIPLAYAVFVGVMLNIALYLRRASMLHLHEMVSETSDPAGPGFLERPLGSPSSPGREAPARDVVFLQLQGDLFFGQADELEERLGALRGSGVRVVVIRLKRTLSIDSTVLAVLDRFAGAMKRGGGNLILCGVRPQVTRSLRAYGVVDTVGSDCFFEATPGVFASARRALDRARELAGHEIDETELEPEVLAPDEGD